MLAEIASLQITTIFLVFCRLGSALMTMPGFGETSVPVQVRLLLALSLTVVLTPVVGPALPPEGSFAYPVLILTEIGVGLFIGFATRLLTTALQIAGTVIAFQTSMSNAFVFDMAAQQQGALTANFLGILGLVLIFVTDLHHLMLTALADSYVAFPPGALPPLGDFVDQASRMVADAFTLGLQLAAPFVLVGVIVSLGMGLLARLMPQVQIFFIAMPLQIALGFVLLSATLMGGSVWFIDHFRSGVSRLLVGF